MSEAESWANEELKKKIENSSLTLGGADLLLVMSRQEKASGSYFEMQLKGVFQEVLARQKLRAARELELAGSESVWLDEIFSSEICYPLELDRQALRSFEQDLRSRMEGRGLKAKRELARGLAGQKG